MDTSGLDPVVRMMPPWSPDATLAELSRAFRNVGLRLAAEMDEAIARGGAPFDQVRTRVLKAAFLSHQGEAERAYQTLCTARKIVEGVPGLRSELLCTVVFLQGVAALRLGETENCVNCRGASACILPIDAAAVHRITRGSELAAGHFAEYLRVFPDDLEAKWLLNIAAMTLGKDPASFHPDAALSLERFRKSEFDIGVFRDIGHEIGLVRLNQAGGGIMDDFDNDGLLDLVVSSSDPTQAMAFYRNTGAGKFADATAAAGLGSQLGGLYCVQADYNNDGNLDICVLRGAWMPYPMRLSLLQNDGKGHFTDVTRKAGLGEPANSISAGWCDYDRDGWLDLFVCCERQPSRLYRNRGDGTFADVAEAAGLRITSQRACKGSAWFDYDNDDCPDLFLTYLDGSARLFRNRGDGTFENVTAAMGIDGPEEGFSCWAFDYDNDGWQDLFATNYLRSTADLARGVLGLPYNGPTSRLFRNLRGRRFEDVTRRAGLAMPYATMGSNYADFDGDGFLDFYLATGGPDYAILVPNRMFRNVDGRRFSEVTGSTRTGHLQKGHSVACGDWDRDGDVDLFVETGGAVPGDRYHNLMFRNPGHGQSWLTLKLVGTRSNRSAIGARIRIVTGGPDPLTVHRHVSSGSSFGANPLQQTIGLGAARMVERLEVRWPASRRTQLFRDLPVDRAFELTEGSQELRRLY